MLNWLVRNITSNRLSGLWIVLLGVLDANWIIKR